MKNHHFPFLAILFLMACSTEPEAPKTPAKAPDAVVEWLNIKANESLKKTKRIVLVSGDEEYRSEEMLPQLARILAKQHGFDCRVLFAQDPEKKGVVNPNYAKNIPGLSSLQKADLMILFTRFRDLPDEQMQYIQNYLLEGKPVLAVRTATHAFEFKDTTSQWYPWSNSYKNEDSPWHNGFGRLVLGEKWHTHHGHHKHQSTRGLLAEDAANHPIANGLKDTPIWGSTDVYGVRLPLPGDAQAILMGQVVNRKGAFEEDDLFFGMRPTDEEVADTNPAAKETYNPNEPMMPIAWTKSYQLPDGKKGQTFTSTIGASSDFLNTGVRRLLVNASYHLLGLEVPTSATVEFVGSYNPSAYSFKKDAYWAEKNLRIKDMLEKEN